jgi:release factor glutamine methyltransferase
VNGPGSGPAPAPGATSRPGDGPDGRDGLDRLDGLLRAATARLADAAVPTPRVDAELLAAHVLGLGRGEVQARALSGAVIPADARDRFTDLLDQRAARIPLQHLTGRAGFRTVQLRVGPGVFVPRPETEAVAGVAVQETARRVAATGSALVVDLCTGSGAIALAVATEQPAAWVVALELDPQAHAWARVNLGDPGPGRAGRIDLRLGDVRGADTGVLADLAGQVDVVVANPPYIPDGARPVDPEVAEHDPDVALYGGGTDGLDLPAAVLAAARGLLVPGGLLVLEHADTQGPGIRALAAGESWEGARTEPDLTGRPRMLVVRRRRDGARLAP